MRFGALALLLGFVNWSMGAAWAVGLSQLTVPEEEAYWHHKKEHSIWWASSGG